MATPSTSDATERARQLPARRRGALLDFVAERGQVTVTGLAEHFGVSIDTIRRDLDQLDARLLPRPDPLRNITPEERAVLRRHWGEWPTDDAGVIVQSLAVAAVGIAPGAQWLGA